MKKLQLFSFCLLVISTFLISFDTYGQSRTPDKYYYAEVRMAVNTSAVTEGEITVSVDFGKNYPSIEPAKLQLLATKIKTFKNGVDILNCMGDEGWEYIDKQVQHESMNISSKTIIAYSHNIYISYTFRKQKL